MMMNKKGFTLIELLAVIAIIAMISLIAIPNIVGLRDDIKKDQMLNDAKKLISMAKYKVNTDYAIRNLTKPGVCSGGTCTFNLVDFLAESNDIGEDPDGTNGSNYLAGYVTYERNTVAKYCVYLEGVKRKVCSETNCGQDDCCNKCVYEENLHSRNNVHDKYN